MHTFTIQCNTVIAKCKCVCPKNDSSCTHRLFEKFAQWCMILFTFPVFVFSRCLRNEFLSHI